MSARALAAAAALAQLVPAAAAAQTSCAARPDVVKQLDTRYAEAPVGMGLASNGGVLEVFASRSGRSWTVLITMPDGRACVIAAGQGWETLPRLANDPGT